MTNEEMVIRAALEMMMRKLGEDVLYSDQEVAVLEEAAAALESEEPLREGWAFLDDFTDHWDIGWLQDQSPSARYLIVTERI